MSEETRVIICQSAAKLYVSRLRAALAEDALFELAMMMSERAPAFRDEMVKGLREYQVHLGDRIRSIKEAGK